jgi:TIR domain
MPGRDGLIFVSYRRAETRDIAGRLADRLMDRFGEDRVFLDVVTIEPGIDFVTAIEDAIKSCSVAIVVIGPRWLTLRGLSGRSRIEDPYDQVRIEVHTALTAGIRIIPVLVDDAVMPRADQLPTDIQGLARIAAARLVYESFRADVKRIIDVVGRFPVIRPASPVVRAAATTTPTGIRQDLPHGSELKVAGTQTAVILPGHSVRGVPIGASVDEVKRSFGKPEQVSKYGAFYYLAQGLEIDFTDDAVRAFSCMARRVRSGRSVASSRPGECSRASWDPLRKGSRLSRRAPLSRPCTGA